MHSIIEHQNSSRYVLRVHRTSFFIKFCSCQTIIKPRETCRHFISLRGQYILKLREHAFKVLSTNADSFTVKDDKDCLRRSSLLTDFLSDRIRRNVEVKELYLMKVEERTTFILALSTVG